MDSYSLKYIIKGASKEKELSFQDKEEVIAFVKCLHRWVAFIEWKAIKWVGSFSSFKIWLQNYDIKTNENEYLDFRPWEPDPYYVSDEPWFVPIDGDVTNTILNECKFTSGENNMTFEWNILTVYWESFSIKKESKLRDLLEILFSSKEKFMSYDDMKELYSSKSFDEVTKKDFHYESVRGLMKYKLGIIKSELELKESILTLTIKWITKNI